MAHSYTLLFPQALTTTHKVHELLYSCRSLTRFTSFAANFTEGVYIDYKHFIAQNITPRYAFGYGLTYSNFSYAQLEVDAGTANRSYYPPGNQVQSGGLPSLWDIVAIVSCTVTNTSAVSAAEVAQLYVNIPGGPAKVLRGFEKQQIAPGQCATFEFSVIRRDLSTWTSQGWTLQRGEYLLYVGKSVLDTPLTGSLTI